MNRARTSLWLVAMLAFAIAGLFFILRSGVEDTKNEGTPVNTPEVVSADPADTAAGQGASDTASPDPAVAESALAETIRPPVGEALRQAPFSHEFLHLDSIAEERFRELGPDRWERVRRGTVREYPDPVVITEVWEQADDGTTVLGDARFEIAAEWILRLAADGRDRALAAEYGATIVGEIPEMACLTVRFADRDLTERLALKDRLEADPRILEVLPNELIWPAAVPNDPSYGDQWELRQINPEPGWDLLTDAAINDRVDVVAAIIDTGVNFESAEILPWINEDEVPDNGIDDDGNGRIDDINGFDFFTRTGDVQRSSGHGVGVSSYAGSVSDNGIAKASPAWKVEIMAGVVFSTSGAGSTSAAANAIFYAAKEGAQVINCSFVGGSAATYSYVFNAAEAANVIVVAGAGNNGKNLDSSLMYPVCSTVPNVIGAGASDQSDKRSSFSNYSSTHVEVFAPNTKGTSYSAPIVTSLVALLRADDPEAPYAEIIERVIEGVDRNADLANLAVSGGRINLTKSLRMNILRRPANLEAWRLSSGAVRLFWRDQATAETGFIVERSTVDPDSVRNPDDPEQMTWSTVNATIPANQTWFEDASAPAGNVFYRVRAASADRPSARNFVTRVAPKTETAPAVTALSAKVETIYARSDGASIELAWLSPAGNQTGFVLERSENGGTSFYELARLNPDATGFFDGEVRSGSAYTYRLKTSNAGYGEYSQALAATATAGSGAAPIVVPTSAVVTLSEWNAITLAWSDDSPGELGYRVLRAQSAAGPFTAVAELGAGATGYVDATVLPESDYFYRIEVFDAFGAESTEGITVTTPAEPAVLVAPTALKVEITGATSVSLAWADDTSERQTGYIVERAVNSEGTFAEVSTVGAAVRSLDISGLEPDESYRFRVSVTDGTDRASSSEVTVTMPPPPPELVAVQLLGEVVGANSIVLRWQDHSEREDGYLVEVASQSVGPFVPFASLAANAAGYEDDSLIPGQTRYYRVAVTGTDFAGNPLRETSGAVGVTTRTVEEQWRFEQFGSSEETGDGAPDADPDGDGWTNLIEFATGNSPTRPQPFIATPGMDGDHRVSLAFGRRWNPTVRYRVEATGTIGGDWAPIAVLEAGSNAWTTILTGVSVTESGEGDLRQVTVTDAPPTASGPRYLRLAVERAE